MRGHDDSDSTIYLRDEDHVRALDALFLEMSQEGNDLNCLAETYNEESAMNIDDAKIDPPISSANIQPIFLLHRRLSQLIPNNW